MSTLPRSLQPFSVQGASTFQQIVAGNINVPDAASIYQSYLFNRSILAPIGVKQIGNFAFDYQGADNVSLKNSITNHYVEDNTARQDHIATEPYRVTLQGYVSELSLAQSVANSISAALADVQNQLSQADAYLGVYTPGATQAMQAAITQAQLLAIQVEQAAARAAQIASFFTPGPQMNKQQAAFATLSSLALAGTVFTVYTPFQVFFNMVIDSLEATQPEKTRTQSDFRVTMMQMRFVNDLSQSAFYNQFSGNAASNYQPQFSAGNSVGVETSQATVFNFFS